MNATSKQRIGSGLAAVGGALLLAWAIRVAGAGTVLDGVRRLGIGFVVIVLLGGFRLFLRTLAWRWCLGASDRLSVRSAFLAFVAGDSLGNVTPFGLLISEPSKIILTRRHVPPRASVAALTVENLLYSASVVVLLLTGTAALLLSFPVVARIHVASLAIVTTTLALTAAGVCVLRSRWRVVSGLCALAIRHNVARQHLEPRLLQVKDVEDQVFGFVARHPDKVAPVLGLEALFHVAAVAEIWIALSMITGASASIMTALILESVNRTLTTAFQFIPMWLGVDEAGTGLVTAALQLGAAPGISLALARKGRNLIWTAVGIALLVQQGFSIRSTVRDAEALAATSVHP